MTITAPRRSAACLAAFAFLAFAAPAIAADTACGSVPNDGVCLGTIDVPPEQRAAFLEAGHLAIDAVFSDAFESDLKAFVATHTIDGAYAPAWKGVDADAVVKDMRRVIAGQRIATYGGVGGWFKHTFAGNVAYDGVADGPIRLNRWALPRSPVSLANTIAHEVAHRIGLKHPSSGGDQSVAKCEPPYVIGSLVEKQALGDKWKGSLNDCSILAR